MPAEVLVLPIHKPAMYKDLKGLRVSTVAKNSGLSPFVIGPCRLWGGNISHNMENAWQYSKVYHEHMNGDRIALRWIVWARMGWLNRRAVRYPMGKGAVPCFSFWEGQRLGYIEARKRIYGPLYVEAVETHLEFLALREAYRQEKRIILLDYDAYNHKKLGMSLSDVLNCPERKMGHAFVLAMLLQQDPALEQMKLRS